jgi:regulator of protease activity HflC (stomatin/prohibitin superfamily)
MGGVIQLVRDVIRGEADPLATAIVVGAGLLIGFLLFCVRFIREGEQAAVLRFGRFVRVIGPGFIIVGPPWRSLQRIHIRQT